MSLTSPLGPGIVVFRTPRSIRGQHKSSLVCAAATGACRSGPVPCVFRDKKEPRALADPEKPLWSQKDSIYVLPLGLWRHCGELCQVTLDARLCRTADWSQSIGNGQDNYRPRSAMPLPKSVNQVSGYGHKEEPTQIRVSFQYSSVGWVKKASTKSQ